MTARQTERIKRLIADCTNGGFLCGDWDAQRDGPYDTVYRQSKQAEARLLAAVQRLVKRAAVQR